jgi:hypothetical protein
LKLRKTTVKDESKIESYAANANADLLGLSQQEYDSIRNEATIVIHVIRCVIRHCSTISDI